MSVKEKIEKLEWLVENGFPKELQEYFPSRDRFPSNLTDEGHLKNIIMFFSVSGQSELVKDIVGEVKWWVFTKIKN